MTGIGHAGGREPRLPDRAVWVNGRLCRGAEAALTVFDRGARDGEGLFESFAVYGGEPFQWQAHLERLVLAAAELGFPVPPSPDALRRGLDQVLAANGLRDAAARLTVTRGIPGGRPTRAGAWIEAEALDGRLWHGTRRGAAAAIVSSRPFEPGPLGGYKTTSRLAWHLAREEARVARADEAILVARDGEVLEGAASNVFAVEGDRVITPPLARGILPGITRRLVFDLCRALGVAAVEVRLDLGALREAREAFVTNSIQGVVPLVSLDGQAYPSTRLGVSLRERQRQLARGVTAPPSA